MHHNFSHNNQSGFTILELMIATMVFSTILLLCTFGIIQIGNTYYRGGALVRTQNANRKVIDALTSAIQYGGSGIVPTKPVGDSLVTIPVSTTVADRHVVCIGNLRIRFQATKYVGSASDDWSILVDDQGASNCNADLARGSGKELLGKGMRITELDIKRSTDSNYSIKLAIAYGTNDLIDSSTGLCKPGAGNQFCATSVFETTVQRRVQ